MDLFMAIILGIIQGLTEPLPISSSAHLFLTPWVLGWPEHSLTFDVALHGGTAFALIIYFWKDWVALGGAFLASLRDRNLMGDHRRRLVWSIVAATFPAAIAGLLFEEEIEEVLRDPLVVTMLLITMGLVMLFADRISTRRRSLTEITLWEAVLIGTAQALALMPGVSRSGITISAGLFLHLSRADAARFSFLLSGPVVTGAFAYKMLGLLRTGLPADERLPFAVGMLAATVVGYLAVRFLLGYLQKHSLALFVYYRLAVGVFLLGLFAARNWL